MPKSFFRFQLLLLIIVTSFKGISQESTIDYPKGIYTKFEDFNSKIPDDITTQFYDKIGNDTISHRFYNSTNDKRLRKEFAFSDGENLYVNVKGIIKNFTSEDKGQLKDDGSYHIKAIQTGTKYIYFEDYFTSSTAAVFGGLIAASAARRLKGVVYDYASGKFNLFKNAKDFENFIEENHPEYLSRLQQVDEEDSREKRKKQIEDIDVIRSVITEINSK